jgi:hypothetical protein
MPAPGAAGVRPARKAGLRVDPVAVGRRGGGQIGIGDQVIPADMRGGFRRVREWGGALPWPGGPASGRSASGC